MGLVPDLFPSSGRGSEEAVLGCNHGLQSRDVGHRGPGRASAGVGVSGEHLWVPGPAPALLEVPEEGSGYRAQVGQVYDLGLTFLGLTCPPSDSWV